jgi:hypothetical protein
MVKNFTSKKRAHGHRPFDCCGLRAVCAIHTRRAKKLGATNEEIAEAIGVTVVMLGGPSDMWPRDTIIGKLEKTA